LTQAEVESMIFFNVGKQPSGLTPMPLALTDLKNLK